MKRYILLKDLPTFKAGDLFEIRENGNLYWVEGPMRFGHWSEVVCAYRAQTLERFPNILKDWFEEIDEKPKTVYDLKEGDKCYFINFNCTSNYVSSTCFDEVSAVLREIGNLFINEQEAEKELAWRKARQILKQDTKGFKPNWKDWSQDKYYVYWSVDEEELEVDCDERTIENRIYFATGEDAEASIKAHPDEWNIYLRIEE